MHTALRNDHWLHLYGDPLDAQGRAISRALFDAFMPADDDWRELVWTRTRQIWARALAALPDIVPMRICARQHVQAAQHWGYSGA
ncbi:DUF2817 domain-containing protein [Paraburkholderia phymatum]|uniref:DUF2817 domain-containing protein n=1 Tax=Paraburkholderia phymatum TaxID=148447 RepID=UPI0003092932|nr:DUF2817 domain-containing protein [Paraburkholderia phymatum]